jgi:hypothetical protein
VTADDGLVDLGSKIAGVLAANDPKATAAKVREQLDARREYVEETARGGFPVYEVPPEVAERFPGFDPADPSTWPEPDRCTEGRPWGLDAYGSVWGDAAARWRVYLSGPRPRACSNRWKRADLRLCGTHANAYLRTQVDAQRRAAKYAREDEHANLARHLSAFGIEADGRATGVVLTATAARELLRILAEADRVAPL